jgi:hypothetical protein
MQKQDDAIELDVVYIRIIILEYLRFTLRLFHQQFLQPRRLKNSLPVLITMEYSVCVCACVILCNSGLCRHRSRFSLNFYDKKPRYVTPENLATIIIQV